jgi:nucleoside-diphosphate-sugar epimerase
MVLVTGASGFLGQHLVRSLSAQGAQVRALYNNHAPTADLATLPGIQWMHCDLLDIYDVDEAMQGINDIYHCAAIVSFDPRKREEMLHANVESTANIVNQAILQDIRKLVHVSSVAALGRTGDGRKLINEEEERADSKYNSAYGISKYLAEMEVWRGMGEGLNAVIVNPGVILGPGDINNLSSGLMKIVYREFPFYSKGVTSWVDVADVVQAMTLLMASEIEAERFIVSAGNFGFLEIFTMMANAMGKKPPRWYAPPMLTRIVAAIIVLKSKIVGAPSLITTETANNAALVSLYDNSKLLQSLPGFAYSPVSNTIEDMARSFCYSYKK